MFQDDTMQTNVASDVSSSNIMSSSNTPTFFSQTLSSTRPNRSIVSNMIPALKGSME